LCGHMQFWCCDKCACLPGVMHVFGVAQLCLWAALFNSTPQPHAHLSNNLTLPHICCDVLCLHRTWRTTPGCCSQQPPMPSSWGPWVQPLTQETLPGSFLQSTPQPQHSHQHPQSPPATLAYQTTAPAAPQGLLL
jgi:hypothetical protein